MFIFFLFIFAYVNPLIADGSSEAYLKIIPLDQIIGLYEQHADIPKNSQLAEFATFFKTHKSLFRTIIERENVYSQDYFIFYRGSSGQRLIYDTARVLYERDHQQALPSDFLLFRDPDDPNHRTDNLWKAVTYYWPPLNTQEKQLLLQELLSRSIPLDRVPLMWDVLSGDVNDKDLTADEQQQVHEFVGEQLKDDQLYLKALGDKDWFSWSLTETQRKQIQELYEKLENAHHGELIKMLQVLYASYDYAQNLRLRNIAVNLSLFSGCVRYDPQGFYPSKDECTPLYWFSNNLGYHRQVRDRDLRREFLVPLLKSHGIPLTEIEKLERIYSTLQPVDDQLLFQILIPKRAKVHGEPLIDTLFYFSHPIGRPAYYLGRVRPSKLLEVYRNQPTAIPGFVQLQGRLWFTREGLLDPHSGIKILVYYLPGTSQQRIAAYRQQLSHWAREKSRSTRPAACSRS